jgi:hypothetical protein
MVERFADAALRHLETAEVLELEGRIDDSAYHYGLVGEMAMKEAYVRAIGYTLPGALYRHINQAGGSLQDRIAAHAQTIGLMAAGRLGGALGGDLCCGLLNYRFADWSLDIRYADSDHCPVKISDLAIWKDDAVTLYNNGVF